LLCNSAQKSLGPGLRRGDERKSADRGDAPVTPESVISIGQHALYTTLIVAAPLLLAVLAVGLIVGMLQAATQINEMTLSFIPKLLALAVVLVIGGPWMLRTMIDYTRALFADLPNLIG
jgi:flagellar biosynthetic protein FliQ